MNFNPTYLDIDDRLTFAKQLAATIDKLPTPFSIGLDAPWGAGKTRFLREPFQEQADPKFNIVFYDAFEHEIDGDPFLSITSQIISKAAELSASDAPKGLPEKINTLKESTYQVMSKSLPAIKRVVASMVVKAATGHTLEQIGEITGVENEQVDDASEIITAEAQKLIDGYLESSNVTKSVKENFKKALADLCSAVKGKTLIVIDELDRCTPSHALKVLESIKHLLLTDKTIFLFSYNKGQLRNSIKHIYGETDADAYLRKFIQIEVGFPVYPRKNREVLRGFIVNVAKGLELDGNHLNAPSMSVLVTLFNFQLRDIESIILTGYRVLKTNSFDTDSCPAMWFLISLYHSDYVTFKRVFINSKFINLESDKSLFTGFQEKVSGLTRDTHNLTYIIDDILSAPEYREKTKHNQPFETPESRLLEIARMIITF